MLVFEERGKPEYSDKNLSEQRRESTTKGAFFGENPKTDL